MSRSGDGRSGASARGSLGVNSRACRFTAYCDCPCHDMCPDCNGTGGRHGIACRYDAEAVRALGGES